MNPGDALGVMKHPSIANEALNRFTMLLPGLDGTGALFAPLISSIPAKHGVQLVEYPLEHDWNFEARTARARRRRPMDHSFALIGESFAEPTRIQLASEQRKGMRGLLLRCTFARNPHRRLAWSKALLNWMPFARLPFAPLAARLLNGNKTSSVRTRLRHTTARLPTNLVRQRLKTVIEADVVSHVNAMQIPILSLRGLQDLPVPPSSGADIPSNGQNIAILQIDGPHALLRSEPIICTEVRLRFMSTCLTKTPTDTSR